MHTPHAASSAQIFLSVVTHRANHIFRKDRNKVKIHFSHDSYRKHDDR